ncbi:MAG: hypothetical protein AAF726_07215 [Planctomycetota bacterium]
MRAALAVLAFLAGLLAANRAIVSLVPLPSEAGLRAKVEYGVANADDFDVVFVGSSATLYGIRPRVFEKELERLGRPGVRAYNLGVGGMGSFEGAQVLRRFLAARPSRLAWVFYEEPLFDPLLWYPDVYNPRYVHWHDLGTTADAIDALRLVDAPPDYKAASYGADWLGRHDWRLAVAKEHVGLFGWRASALGEGPAIARDLLGKGEPLWPNLRDLERTGGWADISRDPDPGAQKAHERFVADPAAWDAQLAAIRASADARPELEGNYDLESLRAILGRIDAAGAETIVYVAPRGLPSPKMSSLADAGEIPTLFPFHLPDVYPELNSFDLRWDKSHLDAKGAELWSLQFARAFAAHLDATGGRARRR